MPELVEKLAGHAPAVRVGGMRVSHGKNFNEASPTKTSKQDEQTAEEKL